MKDQPQLADPEALAAFKRKWEYMYVYAEVGYARAYTSMHYFTFVRPVSSILKPTHVYPKLTISSQGLYRRALRLRNFRLALCRYPLLDYGLCLDLFLVRGGWPMYDYSTAKIGIAQKLEGSERTGSGRRM